MRRSHYRKSPTSVELTPLIDVIFILIIFFAVSTTFFSHHSILELTLPAIEQNAQHPSPIKIELDRHSQLYIDSKKVTLKDLSLKIQRLSQSDTTTPIELLIDESIPYNMVIQLLSRIQKSGYHHILLKGVFAPNA